MNIVITIVGSVIVFLVVFGFAAYNRYLQHKETMALAEKGLLPAEDPNDKTANVLRWGMIFSILGAILVLVMIPFAWNNYWILFLLGLLPLALGLGLTLIYVFAQDDPPPREKKPAKEEKSKPAAKKPAAKPKKTPAKATTKK
jgi:ABC-type Fe3+ transport system permease subunit